MQAAARAMSSVIGKAEEEIGADEELNSDGKTQALKHVAKAMKRVTHSLKEMAASQANQVQIAQGKATAMSSMASGLITVQSDGC